MLILLMVCFSTLFAIATFALHFGSFWYLSSFSMVAGIYIAANEDRIFKNKVSHLLLLYAISIILSYISDMYAFQIKPLYLIYNIVICFTFYSSIRIVGFPTCKLLDYLGKISLEIYLLHGILIYFLVPIGLPALLTVLLVISGTILAASIANTILTKTITARITKTNV